MYTPVHYNYSVRRVFVLYDIHVYSLDLWSQNTMLVSLKISFCYSTQIVCFVFLSLQLESYQKCCTLFIIIETHSSKVPVIQLPCINRCICRNAYHPIHVLINLVHAWVHVCTHSCTDEVDTWSWLVDAWSWQKGHEYQEQRVITIKEERERNLPHK